MLLGQKYPIFGYIEEGKGNNFTFLASYLLQGGIAQCQEIPSQPFTSPPGESGDETEYLISPPMQNAAKEVIFFFLAPSRILR